jgi:hypothetical protein
MWVAVTDGASRATSEGGTYELGQCGRAVGHRHCRERSVGRKLRIGERSGRHPEGDQYANGECDEKMHGGSSVKWDGGAMEAKGHAPMPPPSADVSELKQTLRRHGGCRLGSRTRLTGWRSTVFSFSGAVLRGSDR